MKRILSDRRAKALSASLFFASLAFIAFNNLWWPWILLAIGLPLAVSHALKGQLRDTLLCLFIFTGLFTTYKFALPVFLPVLFGLAGLYILLKEFFEPEEPTEGELDEEVNKEIEEGER